MTKILLVEDDKSLREIYGVRLLAEGYDIVSAGDGEDALAMAIKEKPTLIISDVMMPKISGFDMLDILRSTTETRDIKVIMMTALSSEDQRARGEQLGADRYLVKSQVGIEDVVRTVHEVLGDVPGSVGVAAAASAPAPVASEPAAAPVTIDPVDDASVASVVPSDSDSAGPLPLQPTEVLPPTPVIEPVVVSAPAPEPESSLPQPTAPFSSPRPSNLGEQVVGADPITVEPAPEAPVVDTAPEAPVVAPLSDGSDLTPASETPVPVSQSTSGLVIEPLVIPATEPAVAPLGDPAVAEQLIAPTPEQNPETPAPVPGTTPPAV